jgi:RimJ/RimL family protein N-acetyltransferase
VDFPQIMNMPSAVPSEVLLREVRAGDLPVLFEHQRDPEGARMAGFVSRDREAFMAHWAKIMANPACALRAIIVGGEVAGNIGSWNGDAERLVGYWIGREFWGRGIATAALRLFLEHETTRPLTARVVEHNVGSIRVLQKAGFKLAGREAIDLSGGKTEEELVFRL